MSIDDFTHDGRLILANDDEHTRLPLSEPDDDGYRYVFLVCCDCGLAHRFALGNDHVIATRASQLEQAHLRLLALREDPNAFPKLRALRKLLHKTSDVTRKIFDACGLREENL